MAGAALEQLKTFEAQGITNLLWAFAVMGYYDEQLLRAVDLAVIPRLSEFEPQHLSNLLWSFAKLGARALNPEAPNPEGKPETLCFAKHGARRKPSAMTLKFSVLGVLTDPEPYTFGKLGAWTCELCSHLASRPLLNSDCGCVRHADLYPRF